MKIPKLSNEKHGLYIVKWIVYLFVVHTITAIIQKIFGMPLWYSLLIELPIVYIVLSTNIHEKFARWYIFKFMEVV